MRLLLAILTIAATGADAVAQTVQAQIDRPTVAVGEAFKLTITASGASLGQPQFPPMDHIFIDQSNIRQGSSTTMKFINGQMSMQQVYTWAYRCTADQVGTWVIPAITVEIEGKPAQTKPLTLKVVPRPANSPNTGRSRGQGGIALADAVRAEATVDKDTCYEGEAIRLVVALKQLAQPGIMFDHGNQPYFPPTTEGFYSTPPDRQITQREEDGQTWEVQEFRQLLFPTRSGDLTIGSWKIAGSIRALLSMGRRGADVELETEPITIHVKPLPAPPPNFSGAVGSFDISGTIASNLTLQAVPVELNVTITGTGNSQVISAPELPALDWAEVLKLPVDPTAQQGVEVQKNFRYSITPHQPGNFEIPALAFTFFNPQTEQFESVSTTPLPLSVTPAEGKPPVVVGSGNAPTSPTNVRVTAGDVAPIATEGVSLVAASSDAPLNTVAFAAPPFLFLAFAGYLRRKRHFEEHPDEARRYFAHSRSHARLQDATKSSAPADAIFHAMAGLAADHYNVSEAGLTSHDIRDLLTQNGIPGEITEQYVKVMRACERARFSGATLGKDEVNALLHGASDAMTELERVWKGRK